MSNIRTLNDLNREGDQEARPLVGRNRQQNESPSAWDNFGQSQAKKTARDENFFDALRVNLCPKLQLYSFLAIVSFIQVGVFMTELYVGGVSNSALLAAESDAMLQMGEKDPYRMRFEYEIWRFICPMFLHGDLMHLFGNVVAQLMIGSSLEADIGPQKFAALYLLSGFGGILFSACCSDMRSVGASTAVYGLVGAYLAFLILNWSFLKNNPDKRCQIIIFLCVGLFLSFLLGAENIDVLGHLGGFLTGTLIGLWLLPGLGESRADVQQQSSVKTCSIWSSAIMCITFLVCFYTLRNPAQNAAPVDALTITEDAGPTEEIVPLDDVTGDGATVEEIDEDAEAITEDAADDEGQQQAQVESEDNFMFTEVPEDGLV